MPLVSVTTAEAEVRALAAAAGGADAWPAYFARHARTFHFAARLFPRERARQVAGVYAFCRFTDDLVDEAGDGASVADVRERLDVWTELAATAFAGEVTGIPLLDEVLGEAREEGVAWDYPAALLEGVGMDLTPRVYPEWQALERYTFCVAGAVGGWLSQLFGIRDAALLERAHDLGHGMQLTNIVRDVGEDLRRGRVYVPEALLAAHGLSPDDLGRLMASDGAVPQNWVAVVETLMDRAEGYYERAWPGIRVLPDYFRRPVAAAASAYRGIHREVRRNGHDNLRRRAHTSLARKVMLAGRGLLRARRR